MATASLIHPPFNPSTCVCVRQMQSTLLHRRVRAGGLGNRAERGNLGHIRLTQRVFFRLFLKVGNEKSERIFDDCSVLLLCCFRGADLRRFAAAFNLKTLSFSRFNQVKYIFGCLNLNSESVLEIFQPEDSFFCVCF